MAYFFSFASQFILLLSIFHSVTGHGFVHNVVVAGKAYSGWNPFVDPYAVAYTLVTDPALNGA